MGSEMCCVISLPCLSCSAGASDRQEAPHPHCFTPLRFLAFCPGARDQQGATPQHNLTTVLPSNLVCRRFYHYHSQLWWAVTLVLTPDITLDKHHLLANIHCTPRYRCSGSVKLTVKCFLSYHSHFDELWGSCHLCVLRNQGTVLDQRNSNIVKYLLIIFFL